jgi:capsular polysaccharide transport system permease protein
VALEEQVVNERKKIGGPETGLAGKLAQFERMALDREFAKQSLTTSLKSLEAAQIEAQRQQLFLQRIVEPLAPDQSMLPDRLRMIASAAGINLIMLLVGWLVFAGLREHGGQE